MKACYGVLRWRLWLGVAALGVFAFSVTLQGQPRPRSKTLVSDTAGAQPARPVTNQTERVIKVGPGIPANLRVLPPIVVNPYDESGGGAVPMNGAFAVSRRDVSKDEGCIAATAGDPCILDAECNDCNPCTYDGCSASVCSAGPLSGFPCDGDDECEGICVGGDHAGEHCFTFLECCSEIGSAEPHGECSYYTCDDTTGGATVCVNWTLPYRCTDAQGLPVGKVCSSSAECTDTDPLGLCVPGFQNGAECDDGLECDGYETCDAGACIDGTPLCAMPTPRCREDTDACLAPCAANEDCDYDQSPCSNDLCNVGTGECYVGDPPCGPGGLCTPPANPEDDPTCEPGRCCTAAGVCSATAYQDCAGGWLATDDACIDLSTGQENSCPAYGSGIGPQGDYIVEVGPVTPGPACGGVALERLGDDYTVDPSMVGNADYVDVHILRMAASVQAQARFAVEFWDVTNPSEPLFIEDSFYPLGNDAGETEAVIHTILFDPPITVPASGVVAVSVATNFTPFGALSWVATDVADVGTNNASTLFVDGELVTTGVLGVCASGDRDGQWCDTRNGAADCPGGGCSSIADVLSFEMVVVEGQDPTGACCISDLGTCQEVLPWECEAQDNVFQGSGSSCDVCQANPFVSCNTTDDCQACDAGEREDEKCGPAACPEGSCVDGLCIGGGPNDGNPCDCPGGACVGVGPCIQVPPACRLHACCEESTGDCAIGFCDNDPAKPCNDHADSTDCAEGETCVMADPIGGNDCPTGWTGLGYGHDCDPNCCQQPDPPTGGDTCMDATPLIMNVGNPGERITKTTSGNNSAATFDDFTEYVCDGGSNDGAVCDLNYDCPDGECVDLLCVGGGNEGLECSPDSECPDGACVRRCGFGIMNPNGATRDPGWWESFYIDKAADVRIDMCCSIVHDPETGADNILRPAWAQIYSECPCGGGIASQGVPAPMGEGLGTPGSARGGPFCDKDNLWMTFHNLPKGTYYYPIYSGFEGTFGVQPDQDPPGGGDYQFHVTVEALPLAACCSTLCVGGDRGGEPCDAETVVTCLNGDCIGGVCVNGDLDGFLCDELTGVVNQCPNSTCGAETGCDETNELICDAFGGFWMAGLNLPDTDMEPVVSCGSSPCGVGSCCGGPGECEDRTIGDDPMTEADCDGTFVGGAECDWDPLQGGPCPVCPAASDPNNCQAGTSGYIWTMDRNYAGRAIADDFIASDTTISEFCFEPCFIKYNDDGSGQGECYHTPESPIDPPPDDFEIRFYEDDHGLPGQELATSPGPVDIAAKRWQGGNSRCWEYAAFFDPPVSGFIVGERYWIEFSAAGSPGPPHGTGCRVYLHGSLEGNGWSMIRSDHYGQVDWGTIDIHRYKEGGEPYDFAFCLEGGLQVPDPMVGACCECDGTCTDGVPWDECLNYWNIEGGAGILYGSWPPRGNFIPDTLCADVTCENQGASEPCPGDPSGVPGEDCILPKLVDEGEHDITNICSSADKPFLYPVCGSTTNMSVTADLWFEYHACGDNTAVDIDICDSTYNDFTLETADDDYWSDSAVAVYSNGTSVCPLPEECDSQGGSLAPYLVTCQDNPCPTNGPTVSVFSEFADTCFLIRVMGNVDYESYGQGVMEIGCGEFECFVSAPAQPERLSLPNDPVSQKIRYLSFSAGDPGRAQAVRVTYHDLPAPYDTWNGVQMYVQQPQVYCENAGTSQPVAPATTCPTAAGGLPQNWYWGAGLDCDVHFEFWTNYNMVHVFDEGIIPGGEYYLDVIEENCTVPSDWETDPTLWSTPVLWTQSRWADLIEDCSVTPCKPPDGSTGIVDVTAILDKWKNLPGNVQKARADIEGSPAGDHRLPDQSINITDVTYCLGAFLGDQYPGPGFPPPSPPPVCP